MRKYWLWPWIIGQLEILPYAKLFRTAACTHDIWYKRGWTEEDRKRVDLMFLRLMILVSESSLQSWWASFYFRMVWNYWKYFFNYKIKYEIK